MTTETTPTQAERDAEAFNADLKKHIVASGDDKNGLEDCFCSKDGFDSGVAYARSQPSQAERKLNVAVEALIWLATHAGGVSSDLAQTALDKIRSMPDCEPEKPATCRWVSVKNAVPTEFGHYVTTGGEHCKLLRLWWDGRCFSKDNVRYVITHWLEGVPPIPVEPESGGAK